MTIFVEVEMQTRYLSRIRLYWYTVGSAIKEFQENVPYIFPREAFTTDALWGLRPQVSKRKIWRWKSFTIFVCEQTASKKYVGQTMTFNTRFLWLQHVSTSLAWKTVYNSDLNFSMECQVNVRKTLMTFGVHPISHRWDSSRVNADEASLDKLAEYKKKSRETFYLIWCSFLLSNVLHLMCYSWDVPFISSSIFHSFLCKPFFLNLLLSILQRTIL